MNPIIEECQVLRIGCGQGRARCCIDESVPS